VVQCIFTTSESSQALAQSMMIVAKLDPELQNKLESKWNIVWKNEWSTSQGRIYRKFISMVIWAFVCGESQYLYFVQVCVAIIRMQERHANKGKNLSAVLHLPKIGNVGRHMNFMNVSHMQM